MDLKLVQLIAYTDWHETYEEQPNGSWTNYSYDWMLKPGAMKEVAKYADGIGPTYAMLFKNDSTPNKIKLTGMVKDAHKNKLVVHPYTIRIDKLPTYVKNGQQLFDIIYNKANVDGAFTDFPDLGVKFLQKQHQHQ